MLSILHAGNLYLHMEEEIKVNATHIHTRGKIKQEQQNPIPPSLNIRYTIFEIHCALKLKNGRQ